MPAAQRRELELGLEVFRRGREKETKTRKESISMMIREVGTRLLHHDITRRSTSRGGGDKAREEHKRSPARGRGKNSPGVVERKEDESQLRDKKKIYR